MIEYRDLYDKNKQIIGKTFLKGEKIPENYYNLIVVIVIKNNNDEYLIQKRVSKKGGQWALTGGHPKAGETSLEGIKSEFKEELGLNIDNDSIELLTTMVIDNHFVDIYYLEKEVDISKLNIQCEEVENVAWASKETILEMINQNNFFEPEKFQEYLKIENS